jgi:conjugative transfer region protein TrbK
MMKLVTTATVALTACATMAACSRQGVAENAKAMSAPTLSAELERCKELGLKSYDDASCRAAQQESNDRFYGRKREGTP